MSRFDDYDGDEPGYDNAYELWQHNLAMALGSKRGQQALRDLREALLALPERRLIARALCTVGDNRRPEKWPHDFDDIVEQNDGTGVCAVGAYIWHKKVKAGADPAEAFDALPTLDDANHGSWETAYAGREAGLAFTLASHLAYLNDETYGDRTPEQRWQAYMDWIDKQLAVPVASGGEGTTT